MNSIAMILAIGLLAPIAHADNSIDCANLKYDDLGISESQVLKKMMTDEGPNAEFSLGGEQFKAADYPQKYNTLCQQIKCLMKRDKASYKQLKDKILKESKLPPLGKKLRSDAMTDLDLETCSK